MNLIKIKRENYITKLRKERLEQIFSIKRITQQTKITTIFINQLEQYEHNIEDAVVILRQYSNSLEPEYDVLWFYLLYDCFIYLDQKYQGNQLLDLMLFSLKQYAQSLLHFLEYKMLDIVLRYEDQIVLEIIEIILKSQVIRSIDIQIDLLVNYISSYIPKHTKDIFTILLLLSNNIDCKAVIISNDIIMNMLLMSDQIYIDVRSKIMSRLSRGNYSILYYFYNTTEQIGALFYLNLKQCLKIILRLISYDETKKIIQILKQQNINNKIANIENESYFQYANIIEEILLEFD